MVIRDLSGINKTLLTPLWGRAKATRAHSRILVDTKALEIVEGLGLDLSDFDLTLHPSNELFAIARTRALHDCVREYLVNYPDATVVNLGAGLDTAFQRLDNGSLQWIDVDLPQIVDLRRRLFVEGDRCRSIAASILETEWMREIPSRPGGLFLLACGWWSISRSRNFEHSFPILSVIE